MDNTIKQLNTWLTEQIKTIEAAKFEIQNELAAKSIDEQVFGEPIDPKLWEKHHVVVAALHAYENVHAKMLEFVKEQNASKIIAISQKDFDNWGCPHCGCNYTSTPGMITGTSVYVKCNECETEFITLADDVYQSNISASTNDGPGVYPELQKHPRENIPSHKYTRPDIRPETGGEFWNPRPIGYDLSGVVKSQEAGLRIVQMIEKIIEKTPESWCDYRPHKPNWIQVKIKAADGFDLCKLRDLCEDDNIITEQRLRQSHKSTTVLTQAQFDKISAYMLKNNLEEINTDQFCIAADDNILIIIDDLGNEVDLTI